MKQNSKFIIKIWFRTLLISIVSEEQIFAFELSTFRYPPQILNINGMCIFRFQKIIFLCHYCIYIFFNFISYYLCVSYFTHPWQLI